MTEPLARVEFDFDLDDLADVSARWARTRPSVRRIRSRTVVIVGLLTAMLLWLLLRVMQPDRPPALAAGVAIGTGLLAAVIHRSRAPGVYTRVARRLLSEAHGEGIHRCVMEVHESCLRCTNLCTTSELAWAELESLDASQPDVELLFRSGVAVVRARAFENDAHRAAFVDLARSLAPVSARRR